MTCTVVLLGIKASTESGTSPRPSEVIQAIVKSRDSVALERGQQSLRIQIGMVCLNGKGRLAWEKQAFFF